jgi:histidine decarboxylase
MYGLYMGRETFSDGTVYFSQDTHYSVVKLLRLLNIRNVMIRSGDNGEIDYEDLRETLSVNRGSPAIIVANIGTTMKGAVDDLDLIRETLDDLEIEDRYIHADAALSGMILPFVEDPQPHGFDAGVDSMSVSGHKLIGSPLPCGIVLTRRDYVARIARSVELVGVLDTTIPGSRSALAPMIIWYALQKHGTEGFRRMAAGMMDTAEYAVRRFQDGGIPAWRNRNSAIVVLPRPGEEVFRKWQIAPSGDIAHIITMPHITRETVDELVEDCLRQRRD